MITSLKFFRLLRMMINCYIKQLRHIIMILDTESMKKLKRKMKILKLMKEIKKIKLQTKGNKMIKMTMTTTMKMIWIEYLFIKCMNSIKLIFIFLFLQIFSSPWFCRVSDQIKYFCGKFDEKHFSFKWNSNTFISFAH